MVVIELKAPKKYEKYLDEKNEFQVIINEVFQDYVEKKQDEEIKRNLLWNKKMIELNNSLEMKLWNL